MDELPKVYTLAEVLKNLAGVRGRTFVLEHLKKTPEHGGGPTHRRWGNKIVFYAEDIPRLMASLERPPKSDPAPRRATVPAAPSADKAFARAQALVAKLKREHGGRQKPLNKR